MIKSETKEVFIFLLSTLIQKNPSTELMQMMWIHISVAYTLSSTILPGRAAGYPSSCPSPFLGRTQILCSG